MLGPLFNLMWVQTGMRVNITLQMVFLFWKCSFEWWSCFVFSSSFYSDAFVVHMRVTITTLKRWKKKKTKTEREQFETVWGLYQFNVSFFPWTNQFSKDNLFSLLFCEACLCVCIFIGIDILGNCFVRQVFCCFLKKAHL